MAAMSWEARFRAKALTQAGALGIDQLETIDCDSKQWWRAKQSGRWTTASRRVLLLDGTPASTEQRVQAALLDAGGGAVLHGSSTLAWCGMHGFSLAHLHVTRRRASRSDRCALATVHRLRDLSDGDIRIVHGIPTVSVLRAIWSEASRYANDRWHDVGVRKIGRLLDEANRLQLVTWDELHEELHALERSGRAGTRIMREAAIRRPPGSAPTESNLETRLEEVIEPTDIPTLVRQRVVGDASDPIGRIDHADPELPVLVETNSLAFHSLPSDQDQDERRYRALVDNGFTVAVVWEPDLWNHPSNVVATIREARRRARQAGPAILHTSSCPWPPDTDRLVMTAWEPPTRG